MRSREGLFKSFFLGGFECSTHRNRSGRRLDLIEATGHDRHSLSDYARLRQHGIRTVRDGIRWHLIEQRPGRYDFSSAMPLISAARATGMQVVWDLCHYGWPDDLDIFSPEFIPRFARLARAFARLLADETDDTPLIVPVNEISFFSWAGATVGIFNPFATGRGHELKVQLVRASIEAIEAFWSVAPHARIFHTDPMVNIVPDPARPEDREAAEGYNRAQFDGWDMLAGRLRSDLGGDPKYLDVIGVNYYPHNQWFYPGGEGSMMDRSHPLYRPARELLIQVYKRYGRPIFISETGTEDEERPGWLRYVCGEAYAAMNAGVPIEGICLYPIVNHPGWEDDRHCHNGLCDYADEEGEREVFFPLAQELQHWRRIFEDSMAAGPR
ncbi:MAG TPA: beta-glucosidase, partial [Blastocatellia bacterium]|nr:beta-glucosidase [Blastocatellia bacterium]